jgi:NTP pyrophosphatase (non-canonical NTP hydrolase)
MCGEAGEAANIAKKMIRHRGNVAGNKGEDRNLPALREKLGRELADVVIYADLTAASQGIELAAAVRVTFDAKSEEIGSSIRLERRTKGEETSDLDDPERVARAVRSVFGNATLEEVRLLVEALR